MAARSARLAWAALGWGSNRWSIPYPAILAFAALVTVSPPEPVPADYAIIRWSSGGLPDLDNARALPVPLGVGGASSPTSCRTYGAATAMLEDLYRQGMCHSACPGKWETGFRKDMRKKSTISSRPVSRLAPNHCNR